MAKRFIDTGLFDDPWFMDLSKDAKILWVYMITRCNHAGVIEINQKLVKFQTGIDNLDETISEVGHRLERLTEQLGNSSTTVKQQLYFIPKFIDFQYPGFPHSHAPQQESAIKILQKYAENEIVRVTLAKELPNYYGNGNGNGSEKKGGLGGNKNAGKKQSKIVIPM